MSKILNMLNSLQLRASQAAAVPAGGERLPSFGVPGTEGPFTVRYGLRSNPFADALDLSCYFPTAPQEAAFRKMLDSVRQGISLGLVTGPSGSGKTVVTQLLLQRLQVEPCGAVLVLATPGMGKTALLREMLREAGAESGAFRSRDLLDALHRLVLNLHGEGRHFVALIDEAHFLNAAALQMLRTISNLEAPGRKLATCLLFAEESLRRRLTHPSYRSLATRMYHRVSLSSMTAEETSQYVKFRLLTAGGKEDIFEEDACRTVWEKSGGICREVSRLCYLALAEAAALGLPAVTRALVEGV